MDDKEKYEKLLDFKKKSPKNEYTDNERRQKIEKEKEIYSKHLEFYKGINLDSHPTGVIKQVVSEKYVFSKSFDMKDVHKWLKEINYPYKIDSFTKCFIFGVMDIEKAYEFIQWHDPIALEIEKYNKFEAERKKDNQTEKEIQETIPTEVRAQIGLLR